MALLENRGYTACDIDFEGGFWLGKDDAVPQHEESHQTIRSGDA